ncbi:MAG: SusC/RagA family TonB-linked outer membrane protein [Bacteroidota bacterium]
MKKLQSERRLHPPAFIFDLKMKLTTLFLIAIVFCMSANDSYSQRTRITIDLDNATIAEVLDEIENTTEFKFIYSVKNVDLGRRVSLSVEQLRIQNVLRSLFDKTQTSYKVRGRQVILSKAEPIKSKQKSIAISQRTIMVKGQVFDNLQNPLPGVSIIEKGTTNGVASDFDGNFEIQVQEGATLVFTSIGFLSQEITATTSFMQVTLKESTSELEEVIVVAQGITKSRKALGFSVSKVATEETEGRPEADISRTLQGKISGVQIIAPNGSSGAATDIVVRGNLSLSQGNQALIVLNNVPFDGNLLDIDPNDIKNITVLKGLNAAVLYGSEGRNGVILIETKSGNAILGKKSFNINASLTTYTNNVANIPEFQNEFGVGNNFITDAATIANNGSYGARFTDVDFVPHPYANDSRFPEFSGVEVPYVAVRNNVDDFFNTGIGQTFSLSASATGETASFNFSTGYTGEDGIIGNNNFQRFNINLGGTAQLNDKIVLSSSLGYSTRVRKSQSGNDVFEFLYRIPRNLDIHNLPFEDPLTGENAFFRQDENPLWTLNNTGRERAVNRLTASINLSYKIDEHHTLKYRGGLQTESAEVFDFRNRGGLVDGDRNGIDEATRNTGTLELEADSEFVVDNTLILGSEYDISETLGFSSQLGINSRFERDRSQESTFTDQIVFDFFRPSNFRNNSDADFDTGRENLVGFFGQFDFDYNDFLYLGLSGRYDIASTLERENQTLFYPGVSLSFVPTSAFNFGGSAINFLKIRGAYATSAGFPGRFRTRNTLFSDPREFEDISDGLIVTNSLFSRLENPDIRPELHREFELGIEGNFFNNAITLNASVFTRISEDQIFETELAPETGFTSTTINAGRVDTEGLEIDLGINLFRGSDFNWDIRNTFTAFESTVVELPDGLERVILDNNTSTQIVFQDTGTNAAVAAVGQPLGSYLGSYVVRDSQGNALINPNNGVLLVSDEVGLQDEIIGDLTPDWRATTIHTFGYKNFTLSGQFEYTKGGTRTAQVVEELFERGTSLSTVNREGTFVIPGVYGDPATGQPLLDANGNTIPNTIQQNSNRTAFSNFFEAQEGFTFDASVFRIREVSLSYNLDRTVAKKLPFKNILFTLTGRNIFFYAPNFPRSTNIDPDVVGNSFPSTTRYALGVSINF